MEAGVRAKNEHRLLARAARAALAAWGAAAVLCAAPSAWAQVYTWIDENGDEHFTDELRKVPERYRKKYQDDIAAEKRSRFESDAKKREENREDAFNAEMTRKAAKGAKTGGPPAAPAAPRGEEAHRPQPAAKPAPAPAVEKSETKADPPPAKAPATRRPYEGWQGSAKTDRMVEEEIEERRNRERRQRDRKHIQRILDSHRASTKALKEEFEKIKDVSAVHADVERQRQRLKEEIKRYNEEIEYWEEILRMDY